MMTMDGRVLKEETRQVTLPALSSARYLEWPMQTLLRGQPDLSNVFVTTELSVGGSEVSSNLLYLVPTKQVHLLPAHIESSLVKTPMGYRVTLTSAVLARDVYISFGALNATVSDNYFDLLPGEPFQVTLGNQYQLAQLQSNLRVMSLVDAFAPHAPK
jgi:beta-mannosidase